MCLCVFGVAVCGGCAFRGAASAYNLILARAVAFLMVRGGVRVLAKIANALCENALRGWRLGMDWF